MVAPKEVRKWSILNETESSGSIRLQTAEYVFHHNMHTGRQKAVLT